MLRRFIPDPFLPLLAGIVLLATFAPARGRFATIVEGLSLLTILLLFFFHGARLARDQVVAGLLHWRLHGVILACTFLFFPVVGFAVHLALPRLLPATLWIGVAFLCALPSTVQSAIAFVSVARGNVPAAVASASASQMLGVVLTPALMTAFSRTHGHAVALGGILRIAAEIVIPFAAGHLLRPRIGGWVVRHRTIVGITDRSTILISVYGAFSAAVIAGLWHQLPPLLLAQLALLVGGLLAAALAFTWWIGRTLGFDRADRIVLQFCGTKKSLVQGVPMAKVLFPGPQTGMILLPIMLFHQMQLMACAFVARRYAEQPAATDRT